MSDGQGGQSFLAKFMQVQRGPTKTRIQSQFEQLLQEHGRFLVRFHSVIENADGDNEDDELGPMVKPKVEERRFKSHTVDNVRVRKMCDELLFLEDPSYKMRDPGMKTRGWMPTLQVMMGKHINGLQIRNNPDLTIGGYFLLAQMLTLTRGLIHLDLSANNITSADARVLALGISSNQSVQELRIKENNIGSEGATNFADALKKNSTLLFLDLRMNNIRGAGLCVLADALSVNKTLTKLDLSWNYAGDSSDYVECALLDLKKFCKRNLQMALETTTIVEEKEERLTASDMMKEERQTASDMLMQPAVSSRHLLSSPPVFSPDSRPPQAVIPVVEEEETGPDPSISAAAAAAAAARQEQTVASPGMIGSPSDDELNASGRSRSADGERTSKSPGGTGSEDESSTAALSRKETQNSDSDITAAAMQPGRSRPERTAELKNPRAAHRSDDSGDESSSTRRLATGNTEGEYIGVAQISIISCKNLPQVIWTTGRDGEFLGMPQPYCITSMCNVENVSAVRTRNWNPVWNDTRAMHTLSVWNVVTVKVMHTKSKSQEPREVQDQRNTDLTIGAVSLPIGSVINWRGVSKTSEGNYRAFHRPVQSVLGTVYTACTGTDDQGQEVDSFETAVEAALAYDDVASKKDGEKAQLNCSGEASVIGLHVKEEEHSLTGEDGNPVIGVQAGIHSTIRLRIKYFDRIHNYLEVTVERAANLPKMDAGLGSCDAYLILFCGEYQFRSRVVRNSLDPKFAQTFRMHVPPGVATMNCKVQIWDWDRFDDDDHMGDAAMDIVTADLKTPGKCDTTMDIMKPGGTGRDPLCNGRNVQSKIHVKFNYHGANSVVTGSEVPVPDTASAQ